jgi:fumarate reductase subunit C
VTAILFLAQRLSAAVLALAVTVHLATIIYAARSGMTAADILARTRGNVGFLILYGVFVLAIAIHAPIGLRNVLREWTAWRGRSLDVMLAAFALLLLALGLRAALAVFIP